MPCPASAAGPPHLNFLPAMEQEHCGRGDSQLPFTTSNYGLTTCPADEFRAVLAVDAAVSAGPRRMPDYRELAASERSRRAGLTEVEVVAIVLYTGPMVRLGRRVPLGSMGPGREGRGHSPAREAATSGAARMSFCAQYYTRGDKSGGAGSGRQQDQVVDLI